MAPGGDADIDADEDTSPVWKLKNIESTYWDEYIATRPIYDNNIFNRVYDYHAGHSASWSSALDIGTGSGSALKPLAVRFDHVVASDNDAASLAFAKGRHSAVPTERISYTLSSGEHLLQHHQPGSFDLITCAETFPLMDTETALGNILTLLRPGGTLAVWFYGPPFFTEAEYAPVCQPILDALMDNNFRPVVSGGGEPRQSIWKRVADGKFSWLDYIPLPPQKWRDVRRHKWNTQARLSFFTPDACDFPIETSSSVGEHETVSEERNDGFWEREWDADMLRKFVRASFPKGSDLAGGNDVRDALFERLAVAMGGEGVARRLSWPAVLILAGKASDA